MIGLDPFDSEWRGSFIHGASEYLPLKSGSVDLAVAATSLDHTLDLERSIGELARVIRPGGSLAIWDHPLETRWRRLRYSAARLAVGVLRWDVTRIRSALLPERVRIYDNGIVLWTPKGYADPFHEPRSRRPSWPRRLRKAIEAAGFEFERSMPAEGFSHFVRR